MRQYRGCLIILGGSLFYFERRRSYMKAIKIGTKVEIYNDTARLRKMGKNVEK